VNQVLNDIKVTGIALLAIYFVHFLFGQWVLFGARTQVQGKFAEQGEGKLTVFDQLTY